MTDYSNYTNTERWIRPANRSHNQDYRVIAMVQLLARQAAQEDYDELLKETQGPAQEKRDTIQ